MIILIVVAVSFVVLLVYGVSRSEQPKRSCERLPTFSSNEEPDEDDLEDWCPPRFAENTRGLQARFAPGLGQGKRTVDIGQVAVSLNVQSDPEEEVRAAKLRLLSGNFAIVKGPDNATVCLCAKNAPIPGQLRDQCQANWRKVHAAKSLCQPKYDRGAIPFSGRGGNLVFPAGGPPATVQVE